MVAFVPISSAAARQILSGVSAADESALLSDFVEAGLIRGYAKVVETLSADGGRTEVRDPQIHRDIWKRIVAEGKVEELLARSSVKLEGDGLVGGRPAVTITGVRFNEANVREAATQHGCSPPIAPVSSTLSKTKGVKKAETITPDAPPLIQLVETTAAPKREVRAGLPEDAVMVSIKDVMDILDVSRGTVGNLVKRGVLEDRKVGARTLVVADSIRTILNGK